MKIILTEAQLKNLINEQVPGLGPVGGYDFQKPKAIQGAGQALIDMEPHERNNLLMLGSLFIPVIGPYIAAGLGVYDASVYYKQGKKDVAALTIVFSLLPGIGKIANKIPGVKQLGQKGMTLLADKIAKGVSKLTPIESEVIKGINLHKNLIHSEADGLLKRVSTNIANSQKGKVVPSAQKVFNSGDKTISYLADTQAKSFIKDKILSSPK